MQGFYIFLAVAGIICVVLSFLLSEKLDAKTKGSEVEISEEIWNVLLAKSESAMNNTIQASVEKSRDDALEEVTKELNRLTNEKIMAVDEFSDTVLEKINQNHSEVIFLYNMLNEKERELKEVISNVNQAANKKTASTSHAPVKPVSKSKEKRPAKGTAKVPDKKEVKKDWEPEPNFKLGEQEKKKEAHTREEILEMHENGQSITDIAQKLQMGKGEIKLIIDLYQGAKQ